VQTPKVEEQKTSFRPKRVVKRSANEFRTPSIKDALNGKFKDDEGQISAKEQFKMHTKADEFEPFTEEELAVKWKIFLKRLDDQPNLQSTLTNVPELKEDFKLLLEIDNTIQDELIDLIKPELVSFLRKELKNSKIELATKVSDKIKNRIIYTDLDKFDELVKKNPHLKTLKQKFNLDFGQL
jgi:hypothetical protein